MEALFVDPIVPVFFVYGLAFYTMGLAIVIASGGPIPDSQVRRAMFALAAFSLIHGFLAWFELFFPSGIGVAGTSLFPALDLLRVAILAFSFLLLGCFGIQMLLAARSCQFRWTLLLAGIFSLGAWWIVSRPASEWDMIVPVLDTWTRYSLGVSGGLLAGVGLIVRSRDYRRQGLKAVAQGWLVAGIALVLYGLIGQSAPPPGAYFPANAYNSAVFQGWFGFPIQLLRAATAVIATFGLVGALRALDQQRRLALQLANEAKLRAQDLARREIAQRAALQSELLRRTVAAQESERARIARELHDETGQTISAIRYQVAALQSALMDNRPVEQEAIRSLEMLTCQAFADLSRMVTDLRPAQLDDLGLVAAVHWLGDQADIRLGLKVDIQIQGRKARLSPDVETALFRVTQEALTNIARHAQVDTARLSLTFSPLVVTLEIADQGVGFSQAQAFDSPGRGAWGIVGMRERIASVGGVLEITSAPGQGTTICAIVPIPSGDHDVVSESHQTVVSG
jgi:signal transduction histidine kinase